MPNGPQVKGHCTFFQDDWKLRPNLTLNLGLRWEYFKPLTDANNRLTNINFGPGGVLATSTLAHVNSLIPSTKRNFGPRLGFAWSPSRFHGDAVVRGGGAIAFNRPTTFYLERRVQPPVTPASVSAADFRRSVQFSAGGGDGFGSPFDGGAILYALAQVMPLIVIRQTRLSHLAHPKNAAFARTRLAHPINPSKFTWVA